MELLEKARRFLNKKHDAETSEMVRDLVYEIEARDEHDKKYAEHNTVNNPNDLPEESVIVLAYIKDGGANSMHYVNTWLTARRKHGKWLADNGKEAYGITIWREIEK